MSAEGIADLLDADIEQWYEAQRNDGTVNRNVMAVGLIMCEHMSTHFPLDEFKWFTGTQVSLLGGNRIKKILARHGEERPFASEGGRTSRGSQDLARSFEAVVNGSSAAGEFEELGEDDQLLVIDLLQAKMVGRIRADFYDRQRLPLEIDFNKHTRHTIDRLLATAREKGGGLHRWGRWRSTLSGQSWRSGTPVLKSKTRATQPRTSKLAEQATSCSMTPLSM